LIWIHIVCFHIKQTPTWNWCQTSPELFDISSQICNKLRTVGTPETCKLTTKGQDIYPAAVWIATRLFLQHVGWTIGPGPTVHPAADLHGFARHVQAPNDAHRYRLRTFVSVRRTNTAASEQLPDLGRSVTDRRSGQPPSQA